MEADHESALQAHSIHDHVLHQRGKVAILVVPVLPLVDSVIFPNSIYPLTLHGEQAASVVSAAEQIGGYVGIFQQRREPGGAPTADDVYPTGTLSRLTDVRRLDDGAILAEAIGVTPVRIVAIRRSDPYMTAEVETVTTRPDDSGIVLRLHVEAAQLYRALLERDPDAAVRLLPVLDETTDGDDLAYLICSTIPVSPSGRQALLDMHGTAERLARVITYLRKALHMNAHPPAAQHADPEASLDQVALDRADLEGRIESAGLSNEAQKVARREIDRLATMTAASPDYNLVRTYLETLADLPWQASPEPDVDLQRARELLDHDHFGVADVKARILEHLAVRKLRSERPATPSEWDARQPMLCLLGPPGVGKTSLGRSIATALGRPFVRISLGGVTDEAEIRGHRRTYVGAMPGRIVQALLRTGSSRPVIMLDELDKIGDGRKGDPSAALLDVLDPEQQREYVDQYLDVPFDISGIVFIATANTLDAVPEALRDRLEVILVPGYTEEEKVEIATRHIVPRQLEWHALGARDIKWTPRAIEGIVRGYTREAGVRQLEREVATVCRRVAACAAEGDAQLRPVRVTKDYIAEILGPPRFLAEEPVNAVQPGVVTGLFWTPVGGDVMHVEAVIMPGSKTLTVTGQLGAVMCESAQAALSYVRSNAVALGIDPGFFEHNDLHLHVPSGAVAKDGPSAGMTLATALISLLSRKAVPTDIAMTGEITLTGRVLPVGGIKEKVLAARRAGIRTVIMPSQNCRDLEDVQPEALADVTVRCVDSMDDVLEICFPSGPGESAHPGKPSQLRRLIRRSLPVRRALDDALRPDVAASSRAR